jgi:hypothetical protein
MECELGVAKIQSILPDLKGKFDFPLVWNAFSKRAIAFTLFAAAGFNLHKRWIRCRCRRASVATGTQECSEVKLLHEKRNTLVDQSGMTAFENF